MVTCCSRSFVLGDYEVTVTHEYNPPMSAWRHRYHDFELEALDRRTYDHVARCCANGSAYAFAALRRRLTEHARRTGGSLGSLRSDHWQLTATDQDVQRRASGRRTWSGADSSMSRLGSA